MTGFAGDSISVFIAVEIALPDHTVRLFSGDGFLSFLVDGSSATFSGIDDVAGTLSSVSPMQEAIATEAPRFQINLMPETTGGIADLASPFAQGSWVRAWAGEYDDDTGTVTDIEPLFDGFLDVVRELVTDGARYVEVDCGTDFERFFVIAEGQRWTDAAQKEVWPDDDGLAYVSSAGNYPMWGVEAAAPQAAAKNSFAKPLQEFLNLNK